ncbi:ribonuclease H1-like isoform X2 [Rhinatrema bivittatum]|uniref:ribonuclease H1-like isoform X2 n=1 Tax=Rhinatrema bivittatum TaxID=194408 RepID=UPI00112E1C4F|nr:ribonuclease H1-like isoform X2 [Rhinatrema bivittatum]
MSYYAVRTGRQTGVYRTWEDCKEQVHRFPSARYKKFNSKQAAWNFVNSEDSAGPSSGYGSNTWYEKPSFSGYKRSYQQSSSSEDEEYEPKHAKYRAVTYTSDNLQLAYTEACTCNPATQEMKQLIDRLGQELENEAIAFSSQLQCSPYNADS